MSVAMPNTAFSILSRVVTPDRASLPADTARAFLALNFAAEDVDRMNEQAERARAGMLSVEEQEELDQYERIGYLLSLLHSRARISLGNSALLAQKPLDTSHQGLEFAEHRRRAIGTAAGQVTVGDDFDDPITF